MFEMLILCIVSIIAATASLTLCLEAEEPWSAVQRQQKFLVFDLNWKAPCFQR